MNPFGPRFCRSPLDFERAALDWMLHWGFGDACLTNAGPDDGIDVAASDAIAQVKAWMTPIGISEVQRLKGAAHDGRAAFFFSLMDYTEAARRFADDAEVRLFRFLGYDGSVEPANASAIAFLHACQLPTLIKRRPESSVSAEALKSISDLVADAFNRAAHLEGFAVLVVRDSGNRYVQYHAGVPAVMETVGREHIDPRNPLTPEQLEELAALGWPQLEDAGGNFAYPSEQVGFAELVEAAVRTLVEVHGVRLPDDLCVSVDR